MKKHAYAHLPLESNLTLEAVAATEERQQPINRHLHHSSNHTTTYRCQDLALTEPNREAPQGLQVGEEPQESWREILRTSWHQSPRDLHRAIIRFGHHHTHQEDPKNIMIDFI